VVAQDDGEIELVWDQGALKGWLEGYAEFEKALLVRCELLGGAPARGTEIVTMTYRNTATRTRNFYVLGDYVAIIRQYTKMGAISGADKLIPHAIDALTADLIIQDLVVARPFAELAVRVCYPGNVAVQKAYRELLWVNNVKPFTSEDLSAAMKDCTFEFFGFGVGMRAWRHIHVALRRKHCAVADTIFDGESEESIDSLQAGHTRATENRIYGLTTDSLAGSEDVLPIYLKASTYWQKFMHVFPGVC
jgi:hypothetical protein